jgi:hypothetical protein
MAVKASRYGRTRRRAVDELLTIAEIEARYPSEWVLLEDPETNEVQQVLAGKVRYHCKDRDELYEKAIELRLKRGAVLFTGGFPEDEEFLL